MGLSPWFASRVPVVEVYSLAITQYRGIIPKQQSNGGKKMLTAAMFTSATTEVTTMIGLAIAGGMGIYGSIKGVQVGLSMFSRLIAGR